jgi:hypothetical protein
VRSICESTRPAWTTNNPGAFIFWIKNGSDELPANWADINPPATRSESDISRLMSVLDQLKAEEEQ